jgi:hypothetical protein
MRIVCQLERCEEGMRYAVLVDDRTVWSRFVHWEQGQIARTATAKEQDAVADLHAQAAS